MTMDKKRREKVKEALRNLDEEPVPVPLEDKPKEASKEPTTEDLKAQVDQLRMENQQLKAAVANIQAVAAKLKDDIVWQLDTFRAAEERKLAAEHEARLRQQAAMRQAQKSE
jgi:predicted RNase H-like nuclease (RuvC/YqgF family)